jgi:Uma2 family endonuclease
MSQLQKKPEPLVGYPYHLPDKPVPTGPYITYEEFFEWADEDTLAEWVDGRIEMSSPANRRHQQIAGLLYEVLTTFARLFDSGVVLQNPFQMKLAGKRGSGRKPDLMFLAKANLARLVRGPADLTVEIISPESEWRDRHTKFQEYAAGGVQEYWLIDPDQQQAEFYRLNGQDHYESQPLDPASRYYSQVLPGFWLKPAWLWLQPLPAAQDLLKLTGGETYTAYQNRPPRTDL